MAKQKLLKLTNDYVFKRSFGYSGDEEVTKVFLRDILETEISNIELDNNPITEKELIDDKVGIMDIKATLNNTMECDIEVQVVSKSDMEKRILFYWGKLYTSSIHQGDFYEKLPKTISILIADFELSSLKEVQKYITKWNIREEEYYQLILTDVLELYIIELPKFLKYGNDKRKANMNLWVNFLKNPEVFEMIDEKYYEEETDSKLKDTKKAIYKTQKKLEQLSKDKHERELAELREKYIRDQHSVERHGYLNGLEEGRTAGIEEGRTAGLEEGKINEKINTAKKMLEKNMDIEIISEVTGLSIDEIEKLKETKDI